MSDLDDFKAWYVDTLNRLYPIRDAGLAVFMISLPLAERYLRQKNGLAPEQPVSDAFMLDLVRMFPALRDVPLARQFWAAYRHGLLHQATLSLETNKGTALPVARLTHDIADPIQVLGDGSLCVNPVLFSKAVTSEIESNFAVFSGAAFGAPPLPSVMRIDPIAIPSTYIGTGNQP